MGGDRFRYDGYEVDADAHRVVCRYALGTRTFVEEVGFDLPPVSADTGLTHALWRSEAADAAARLLFLLAGVSYYKTAAPPVVDLGDLALTDDEREFLRTFYLEGLGELSYRNGIDLSGTEFVGPRLERREPVPTTLEPGHALVPFGAGIDSIVTLEHVRARRRASLFVVSRAGDRFAAIEDAAAVTGLPVVRADRRLDPAVLRSALHGFLNGHVPVTGILSAIAVVAAVTTGHAEIVMANERSASEPTLFDDGRAINHQWSKSAAFERGFRALLAATFSRAPDYFSLLRARSELWVAQRFAALDRYHGVFRSCNRAFAIDPGRRLDHWCGTCDKCCFIDLVLAPFLPAATLEEIFSGHEPLENPSLADRFRALVGTGGPHKPFECVGDVDECRAALLVSAARGERTGERAALLETLAAEVRAAAPELGDEGAVRALATRLLARTGGDFVPADLATEAPKDGTPQGIAALSAKP